MASFTRVFPGSASLDDSRRACKVEQQDEIANLTNLEPALFKKDNATTKVNVATFEEAEDVLHVRKDLRFVDVSTAQGASDAAALNATHDRIYRGKLFVQNQLKSIEAFVQKL